MAENKLLEYLKSNIGKLSLESISYISNLGNVAKVDREIALAIVKELKDQRKYLKLIASENFSSINSQAAMGNLLTDKYSEGYPGHRFYAGCDNVDVIEARAAEEAKSLFGAEHAYVQPHSGADANMIAFWAILHTKVTPKFLAEHNLTDTKFTDLTSEQWLELRKALGNQRLLGLDYSCGGHLTHGYRYNVSAQMFDVYSYGVNKETYLLDYDEIERQAVEVKPLILLAGYSAYPRKVNFARMRQIADKVGAVLMVDMAHFAGLVAGKVFEGDFDPVKHADVVTSTTHKTLRGPRGGLILCKDEFKEQVDKGCPLIIGGPLPHVMAAKAVAFKEANTPEFKSYAQQIVKNTQALAAAAKELGLEVLTSGSENHLILINVTPLGITGRQAETALREANITLNRNSLPYDAEGPWFTSGLRIGTPAATTLGMKEPEMQKIAEAINCLLRGCTSGTTKAGKPSRSAIVVDEKAKINAQGIVNELLKKFVLYPEIDLGAIEEAV